MKKKLLLIISVGIVSLCNFDGTANAQTSKHSFSFFLQVSKNLGVQKSGSAVKEDSVGYGAATVHSHDLVSTDEVYLRILKNNLLSNPGATGYYRIYGYGTKNMWYNSGMGVRGASYFLEGDTDKHDAKISGLWEP